MVSFVKNGWQGIQDHFDGQNKNDLEDLTDTVLGKYGLYSKLSKLPIVGDAFGNMHGDFVQERDKKTFNIISSYKDYLAQNPDGAEVSGGDVLDIIEAAAKGHVPTKRRKTLFAAGAYLYMLEEHGDAYGTALAPYR